jgi:hypothetical protein
VGDGLRPHIFGLPALDANFVGWTGLNMTLNACILGHKGSWSRLSLTLKRTNLFQEVHMKKKYEDAMVVKDGFRTIKQITHGDMCAIQSGQKTKEGESEMEYESEDEKEMD